MQNDGRGFAVVDGAGATAFYNFQLTVMDDRSSDEQHFATLQVCGLPQAVPSAL